MTRFDTPYVESVQAACAGRRGRRLLKRRQTCIEGLFGQAKTQHGLGRARWRGVVKMQMQSLLTAIVLNVKQLLRSVSGRKPAAYCGVAVGALLFAEKIASFMTRQWCFVLPGRKKLLSTGIPCQ